MAYIKNAGKRTRSKSLMIVRQPSSSRSQSRGRKRTRTPPKTPQTRRMRAGSVQTVRTRSRGASTSKSSGFFKKGTARRVPETMFSTKGIVLAYERGGQVVASGTGATAEQVGYVGHTTMPYTQVRVQMWRAFVKFFAGQLGYTIISLSDVPLAQNINGNLEWTITYRTSPGALPVTLVRVLNNSKSWEDFAAEFRNFFVDCNNYQFEKLQIKLVDAGVINVEHIFNLNKCHVKLFCKSSLKIQNRTINSTGNLEADDVDNVPLYGKSYEGKGNGAIFLKPVDGLPFIADSNSGLILPNPILVTAQDYELNEPPNYKQFQYVSKHGKAHLDPGQIKTSVLNYKAGFTWSRLLNQIIILSNTGSGIAFPNNCRVPFGNFRFFALEKMIQAIDTTEISKVQIAYEHDYKLGLYVSCPRMKQTLYVIDVAPK